MRPLEPRVRASQVGIIVPTLAIKGIRAAGSFGRGLVATHDILKRPTVNKDRNLNMRCSINLRFVVVTQGAFTEFSGSRLSVLIAP